VAFKLGLIISEVCCSTTGAITHMRCGPSTQCLPPLPKNIVTLAKVNGHTIKLTLNKDAKWTKALKFMLADLKKALQVWGCWGLRLLLSCTLLITGRAEQGAAGAGALFCSKCSQSWSALRASCAIATCRHRAISPPLRNRHSWPTLRYSHIVCNVQHACDAGPFKQCGALSVTLVACLQHPHTLMPCPPPAPQPQWVVKYDGVRAEAQTAARLSALQPEPHLTPVP
jgi:hypothetical protein